ncbi:Ig-like domain-containing protein [Patulibacter sp. SYSU D01012]|uniref:Ig-like domain-containing protein n=1 Tax=Patulibacter sp. SYSU D01012 TaxID=2817381 RepID=UPI001B3044D6|nr:Ig-like domain-containing protein [Patulibacter sp. SYSU D01012]
MSSRRRHLAPDLTPAQRRAAVALGLLALVGTAASVTPSGATYASHRANPGNAVTAANDWVPPTVAVTDPGASLRGTVTLAASASDARSGVASVVLQVAPEGSTAYADACTATAAPYACSWDTSRVADGRYKVRAVATDAAGNRATSDPVTGRLVDNTAPTVALADPGTPLAAGNVTLTASADDAGSGVAKVTIQRAAAGTGSWTDVCTQTSAPYACTWAAAVGSYDLRAVAVDAAGNATTSAVVTGRQVVADTIRPTGVSIRTTNVSGGVAGRLDAGDTLTLRYSEPMQLGSILKGWTGGTSPAFTVQVGAGGWLGSSDDALSFVATGTGPTPNIGPVDLGSGSWVTIFDSLRFAATATAATVNGATELTITLGARSGSGGTSAVGAVRLGWSPSSASTDLAGNAADPATVRQSTAVVAF